MIKIKSKFLNLNTKLKTINRKINNLSMIKIKSQILKNKIIKNKTKNLL